jgi:hypothetical protein
MWSLLPLSALALRGRLFNGGPSPPAHLWRLLAGGNRRLLGRGCGQAARQNNSGEDAPVSPHFTFLLFCSKHSSGNKRCSEVPEESVHSPETFRRTRGTLFEFQFRENRIGKV